MGNTHSFALRLSGAQGSRNLIQRRFFCIADRNTAEAQEATLSRRLSDLLRCLLQPGFEGRYFAAGLSLHE
jgi:hypothetical protein